MIKNAVQNKLVYLMPLIIFLGFTAWWIYLSTLDISLTRNSRQVWGAIYQVLALYGAVSGIFISHKWGGYKSVLGRSILAFSIGLFLQSIGQTYSSYYVFAYNVESPSYPGLGDIGFFSSVLSYIYGVVLLTKVSGARFSFKKIQYKLFAFFLPLLILVGSYIFFLKGYEFDFTNKLKIFLDFGYPFGQALYVSIAILVLVASRNFLGGIMKAPILFLIIALLFQYFSDFFFLYEANAGTWYVGNINDYLYFSSYFLMTMALIFLGSTFDKFKES
jgi:hypothetical protein